LLLLFVFLVTGCGSSSDGPTAQERSADTEKELSAKAHAALAARSEAICKDAQRKIKKLGRGLAQRISGASGLDSIGEALVAPGIRILTRESSRLARLEEPSNPPRWQTYTGLFNPIIELSQQRLDAGRAGELSRAHDLELLIATLTEKQAAVARELGLSACGVDFTQALGA
jgi:hypothetical protein